MNAQPAHAGAVEAGPAGPGRLILVVGPSGAGKDTLIRHAQTSLDGAAGIVFARRVVTRPSSAAEDHDTMSPDAFLMAAKEGAFALTWRAHGLDYGIPARIDADVAAGSSVVCNVSRTVISQARARYARVTVALVTAPDEILSARLRARGRSSDVDIAERLARTSHLRHALCPDHVIANVDTVEHAVAELVAVITAAR